MTGTRPVQAPSEERTEALRHFNRGVLMAEEGMIFAAVRAYERVMETGNTELAARSAFNIATLSVQAGDLSWAVHSYNAAIDYGDPDTTPKAAFNLARLLEAEGDLDAAQRALELAAASKHHHVAPQARDRLRLLGTGR
jgi:tetratricopeptide (TPR) repeat protein